jgi:hypothetical protein
VEDRQSYAAPPEDKRQREVVLVFKNAAAAEAFRILEGRGPEWEVYGHVLLGMGDTVAGAIDKALG